MVYIERLIVWLEEGPVLSRLQIECNVEKVSLGEVDIGGYFQAMMLKKLDDLLSQAFQFGARGVHDSQTVIPI